MNTKEQHCNIKLQDPKEILKIYDTVISEEPNDIINSDKDYKKVDNRLMIEFLELLIENKIVEEEIIVNSFFRFIRNNEELFVLKLKDTKFGFCEWSQFGNLNLEYYIEVLKKEEFYDYNFCDYRLDWERN